MGQRLLIQDLLAPPLRVVAAIGLVMLCSVSPGAAPRNGNNDEKPAVAEKPATTAPAEPDAITSEEMRRLRERAIASTQPKKDVAPKPEPPMPAPDQPVQPPKMAEPKAADHARPPSRPVVTKKATTRPATAPTTAPTTRPGPEARLYRFDYFDTPWKDVLDDFSRISGLSLVGDTTGITENLTYRSPKAFTYDEALYQLNELLLMRTTKYLLQRQENQLVIGRLPDLIRQIPPDLMFNTVADFEAAKLPDHQMSLVVYRPPAGWPPIDIIDQFRPRFEDYYGTQVWGDAIVLTGMARDHRRFVDVVGRFVALNPHPPTNEPPWESIPLKHTKAADVQNILRQVYPGAPARAPRPGQDPDALAAKQINIVADVVNNAVLVKASPQNLIEIREMVRQLDAQQPPPDAETRVFKLEHMTADEVANAIRPIAQAEQAQFKSVTGYLAPEEVASRTWNVYAQAGSNMLVVVGGAKGLVRAEELIKSFDTPEATVAPARIALEHVRADEMVQILTQVFRPTKGRQAAVAQFSADNTGNSIIVTAAREGQLADIRKLIADLDQEGPETEREHLVKLERAVASEVAAAMTQIAAGAPATGRRRGAAAAAGAGGAKFFGNDASGYLIVRCDDKDWPRYEKLILELDGGTVDSEPTLRSFALQHADPNEVVSILQSMFTGLPPRKGVPAPTLKFTADGRDNSVRVLATPDLLEKVAGLIAELDISSDAGKVQTIRLVNANAAETATVLSQMFGGGAAGAGKAPAAGAVAVGSTAVKITAEPLSNSLWVIAPKAEFEEIKALAQQMDDSAAGRTNTRVAVPVKFRPAAEVAEALSLLSGRGPVAVGGRGAAPGADAGLKVVPTGDQIVLDGPRDEVIKAIDLVATIDVVPGGREVKVYPVTDAEQAAEALRVLMASTGRAAAVRPGGAGAAAQGAAAPMAGTTQIYPDTYRNVLIVNALPLDFPQIDMLVEAIEKDVEPVEGMAGAVPGEWHVFQLKFRDAYELAFELEDILAPQGSKKGGPKFERGPDEKILLVQCKPRQLPEIERLVKMFDVPSGDSLVASGILIKKPKQTIAPTQAVHMLVAQFQAETGRQVVVDMSPDLGHIEVIDIHKDETAAPASTTQPVEGRGVRPCVLPASLSAVLAGAALGPSEPHGPGCPVCGKNPCTLSLELLRTLDAIVAGQTEPDDDGDEDAAPNLAVRAPTTQSGAEAGPPVRISVSEDGTLFLQGSPDDLRKLEQILGEIEELQQEKIIKIFPIKYADVTQIAQTLEMIFNGRTSRMAAQIPQQVPQQAGQQPGRPPQQPPGKESEEPAGRERRAPQRAQRAAPVATRIDVTPDARGRQLFVQAVQADFPIIIAVLKALDVPKGSAASYRIFQLKNLNAEETVQILQDMLQLNVRGRAADQRRMAAPGQQQPGRPGQPQPGQPPGQPGQPGGEPEGIVASAETTTITADPQTNSIIVAAPPDTIELIADIIDKLEAQPNILQPIMKRIPLEHARAAEVTTVIREVERATGAAGGGPGGRGARRGGSSTGSVSVNADARTNSVVLAGASQDVERIETMVKELDIDTGDEGQVEIYTVKGDANSTANALRAMYAAGGPGAAADVAITADTMTGSVLVRAPASVRAEIAAKIREMESKVIEATQPRTIKLELADADTVASKLQEIFSERGQQRGRQQVKITGVPSTKSLVVQAPDDLFAEIEKHAKTMDAEPIDLDIRSFKLDHAKAVEVVDKLNSLVQQVVAQMRGGQGGDIKLGLFAFTPDPLTNSIIVTGNPVTFMVMKKVLDAVDVEQSEITKRYVQTYVLNRNVSAQQVAANINQLFAGLSASKEGIPPPSVTAEPNSNLVLVTATEAQHKEIAEKIVKPVVEAVSQEARQYQIELQYARADEAANTLNNFFNQWRASRGNKPQDAISIVPDVNASMLLVNATETAKAVFDDMLKTIDVEPQARQTRTFALKYAWPWEVAGVINQQFQNRGSKNPNDQVVASYEGGTMSLIVTANEKNLGLVADLIAQLDVPGSTVKETRFIRLEKARADEVASALNQAWQARTKPDRQGRWPVTITPDLVSNQLLVTSSEEDYQITMEMVRTMDVEPPGEHLRQTRIYQIRFADPNAVVNAINVAYQPTPGRSLPPQDVVRASADWATGSVVITAAGRKQEEIARLIEEMDVRSDTSRKSHVIEVKNSDPRDVAQALSNIYNQVTRGRTGIPPVTFSALQGSTRIVVNCTEAEFADISELVRQIDEGGDKYSGRSVHTITMPEQVKAKDVADSITRLFAGQAFGGQQGVKAEANQPTNTVLVFATEPEFEKINQEVIEPLSKVPPVGTLNIYRVPLRYANADEVARMLQDFFREMQGMQRQFGFFGGGGPPSATAMEDRVTVQAEAGSNMLIIGCTEATKQKIDAILADIDTDVFPGGGNVLEMFPLKFVDAAEMVSILEEYLRLSRRTPEDPEAGLPWWARSGRQDRQDDKVVLVGDMRLKAVESMNAVIVVGKAEAMPSVKELVARLDVPTENPAAAPRVIELQNANAASIATVLTKAFSDPKRAASTGKGAGAYRIPVIVAEDATNSLIVSATASDYTLIERMVKDLDGRMSDEPTGVQIVALPVGVDVEDLARTIERTINDAERNKKQQQSTYVPSLVTIGADLRANALLVAASKAKMDEINSLVAQLVNLKPSTPVGATFIPVRNARPEDLQRLLDDMQRRGGGSGSRGRSSRGGRGSRGDAAWTNEPRIRDGNGARFEPLPRNPQTPRGEPVAMRVAPRYAGVAVALMSAVLAQAAPPAAPQAPIVSTIRPRATTTQPAVGGPVIVQAPAAEGAVSMQLSPTTIIQAGPQGLMVIGPEEDRLAVQALVEMLDRDIPDLRIEYVELKNAQAVALQKSLQDVYTKLEQSRPPGTQPRPEDKVNLIADPRTNGLFVAATETKMGEVLDLIRRSDQRPAIGGEALRTFVLKNRRVRDVEPNIKAVIQMWLRQKGITDTNAIGIARDDQTNSLFITAGEKDLEEVGKVIEQLDTPPPSTEEGATTVSFGAADIMIVPLRVATADKLAPALSKLIQDAATGKTPTNDFIRRLRVLDDRGEPIAELNIDGPTFIVGDPESNSLVCASTRQNLLILREVIKRFDVEPLRDAVDVRVRALKYADASDVAERFNGLLREAKNLTKRPGRGDAIAGVPEGDAGALVYDGVVTPDARTNTVILAGKPGAVSLFEELLDQIDVPGQAVLPFEIIKLEYASAQALETVLDDLMKKRLEALPKGTGPNAGKSETVVIKADPRAETLIVAARGDRMAEVRELVSKLDVPATALVENIRPITLKNGNASDLASKITDLWTKRAAQRETGGVKLEQPVLVADERSNSLIVAASKGDFEAIRTLVEKLEALPFGPIADIRIVSLRHNSAKDLAPIFKKLFDERAKQREGVDGKTRPSDMVAIDADPVTNSLLVACSPENYELLMAKVRELDLETGVEGVVELFVLRNIEAIRAKKTIDDVFKDGLFRPGGGGQDSAVVKDREKVTVATDDRSNTLIVSASPENMGIVRKIVAQMEDVQTPWNLSNSRIFELRHADAVKLAAQLQDYFQKVEQGQQTGGRERVDLPVTVIADERTNRILVGASPDGIARAASLIEKMDVPPEPSSTIEVYRLRDGAAAKIGPMIKTMFEERNQPRGGGGTQVPSIKVSVEVDEISNALVVSASREDHVLIANLVEMLDRRSNILDQVKLFPLMKARATAIKEILEELYKSGTGGAGAGAGAAVMPVAVTTDTRTNAVVVAGPPGELDNIAKLVERLDSAEPIDEAHIGIFPLENADAKKTSELLKELLAGDLTPSGGGGGSSRAAEMGSMLISFAAKDPRGQEVFFKTIRENVQISFDERTNAVIVVAPPPTVALIKNLVKTLDSYKKRDVYVRVFMLRNADAAKTVELLEKIFALDEGSQQQQEFQQGREIRVEGGATSGVGVPTAASQGPGAATRGTFGKPKTTFTSDSRTNSVVVAGWPEDIDVAGDIIDQLDSQDIQDRINYVYALQNAEAPDVVEALDSYFQKETERLGRQGEGLSEARKAEQEVSAVAHEKSNQVILSFSPRYQSQVLQIVRQLDTPPPQVMIQVLLAEVTLDDRFEMGLEFALQQLRFSETAVAGPNGTLSSNSFDVVGGTDLGAAASTGGLGGFSFTVTGEDFNFLVRALQADSKIEVLQRPMIMCQDNQEALINVGQSVPFVRGTQVTDAGQVNSTIEYEDIGIQLEVKPHINPDGFVYMEVKPEISQITTSTIDVGNGIRAPIFAKRNAETTVVVKDGETVVIGGLITTSDQETESKVPILGDLPGLGVLFRTTQRQKTKTELLIVLTPRVVRTVEDARRLSIEARDVTSVLTPEQKQSPLMYGLQITPESKSEVEPMFDERPELPREEELPPEQPTYGPVAPEYGPFLPISSSARPPADDEARANRPSMKLLGVGGSASR